MRVCVVISSGIVSRVLADNDSFVEVSVIDTDAAAQGDQVGRELFDVEQYSAATFTRICDEIIEESR